MGPENESPLFIVGASRSGTTLLRLMLNAHPRIAVPDEFKYFGLVNEYAKPRVWEKPLDDATYEQLVDNFLETRSHLFEKMDIGNIRDTILQQDDRTIASPYKFAARAWMQHYGKARWGEKTPYHLFYADVLIEMFPSARFVYMMRDPRAVVTSMNSIEYFSEDSVLNALNWKRSATVGLSGLRKAVPADQLRVLRYEDLVVDPQEVLEQICTLIDEDFDERMLSFYEDSRKYMALEIKTENVTRKVTSSSLDRWKEKLSDREVRSIEAICGKVMREYGYELEGRDPSLVERTNIIVKTRFFNTRINKNSDYPGYNITYPMFARFRS